MLAAANPALAQPAVSPVLPPELPWNGKSLELAIDPEHAWATLFEASGLERTPRYDQTVAWLESLAAAAPELKMVSLGKSAEGRDVCAACTEFMPVCNTANSNTARRPLSTMLINSRRCFCPRTVTASGKYP